MGRKTREHTNHKDKFGHYLCSESVALAIDLVILWVLIHFLNFHYLVSAAIAYVVAISVHYFSVRKHVFHGTVRDPFHGYAYFLSVGIIGIVLTIALALLMIYYLHSGYYMARIIAALFVIPATYLLNSWLTFIMPKPLPQNKEDYCNI